MKRDVATRAPWFVVALVLVGLTAACGVNADEARPVAGPSAPSAAASAVPTNADSPVVYLARRDELVRSRRPLPDGSGVPEVLAALSLPVTPAEARRGLRSIVASADTAHPLFVAPEDAASAAPSPDGASRVVATDALRALPPAQQQLALAQVTLSLASLGVDSVAFVGEDGTVLAVPAPGGRTLDRPVTAADYASLRAS